jgi:ketosteroid isomerase-like protein
MTREVQPIFSAVDAQQLPEFLGHLTEDVVFRFANAEPAVGRQAVAEAVAGFWTTIDGLTHHLRDSWDSGDVTVVRADVEYQRKDGKSVTVPNADILTFADNGQVSHWQIFIDLAPVYA